MSSKEILHRSAILMFLLATAYVARTWLVIIQKLHPRISATTSTSSTCRRPNYYDDRTSSLIVLSVEAFHNVWSSPHHRHIVYYNFATDVVLRSTKPIRAFFKTSSQPRGAFVECSTVLTKKQAFFRRSGIVLYETMTTEKEFQQQRHPELNNEFHLFIFGYGNVGQNVASLASQIRWFHHDRVSHKTNDSSSNVTNSVGSNSTKEELLQSFPSCTTISGLHVNEFQSSTDNVKKHYFSSTSTTTTTTTNQSIFSKWVSNIFQNLSSSSNRRNKKAKDDDDDDQNNDYLFQTICATTTDLSLLEQEALLNDSDTTSRRIKLISFDNATNVEYHLKRATHVLITIPPVPSSSSTKTSTSSITPTSVVLSNPIFTNNYQTFILMSNHIRWIGLLSTTGVYGNHDGKWVNEQSALYGCMKSPIVGQQTVTALGTSSKMKYLPTSSSKTKASAYRQMEIQCCNLFGYNDDESSSSSPSSSMDLSPPAATEVMENNEEINEGSAHHDYQQQTKRRRRQVCIFRCAGLYGSNASACHTIVKKKNFGGTVSTKQNVNHDEQGNNDTTSISSSSSQNITDESFTSRIHLMDVSRALIASMILDGGSGRGDLITTSNKEEMSSSSSSQVSSSPQMIYNLADDEPEKRSIVMKFAKELLLNEYQMFPNNRLFSLVSNNKEENNTITEQQEDEVVLSSQKKKVTSTSMSRISSPGTTTILSSTNPSSSTTRNTLTRTTTTTTTATTTVSQERAQRRQQDNKRIDNQKLKKRLLDQYFGGLLYPSYREGLLSIVEYQRQS